MGQGLDRRSFLRGAAAGGAAVALGGLPRIATARPGPAGKRPGPATGGRFRQGIASGEPAPQSMRLWTRLEEIQRAGTVELEVAKDQGFNRVVERRRVIARPNRDFTVHARVSGLEPGERYFYRFDSGTESSPIGEFRTLPPADSQRPIRIGIFSCQDWEAGYYTAHAGLAGEDDLDLVVCLGDYIYERSFYEEDGVRNDELGANGDGEVQTLSEYRSKFSLYHSDPNLRAIRATVPLLGIWDDHEVEDNYAGTLPGEATLDPRVEFVRRRRNGYRAYFEHMPFSPAAGGKRRKGARRNYRSLRLGRNADLILLDERRYRDDQPCGDDLPPVPPCSEEERNDPDRTLLGDDQKAWLKRQLRESDATWKLIGNQVMATAPGGSSTSTPAKTATAPVRASSTARTPPPSTPRTRSPRRTSARATSARSEDWRLALRVRPLDGLRRHRPEGDGVCDQEERARPGGDRGAAAAGPLGAAHRDGGADGRGDDQQEADVGDDEADRDPGVLGVLEALLVEQHLGGHAGHQVGRDRREEQRPEPHPGERRRAVAAGAKEVVGGGGEGTG